MHYSRPLAFLAIAALVAACENGPNGPESGIDPVDTIQARGTFLTSAESVSGDARLVWVPGTELVRSMPDDAVTGMRPDRHTAIVALTHDPKLDDLALMEALASPAFYVAALGSRLSSDRRRERLRELDLSPEQISALRGPAGLDRVPP